MCHGAGGGAPPPGIPSDSSTRELVDEGSSLPSETPALRLLKLNLHSAAAAAKTL